MSSYLSDFSSWDEVVITIILSFGNCITVDIKVICKATYNDQ